MKSDSLIIDLYNKRPFFQRFVSESSTTFIWGWWAWICRFHHFFSFRLFWLGVPKAMGDDVVALVSTSSMLMLWSSINNPSPTIKQLTTEDIANHFNISTEQLNEGRNSQVCVVHHDVYGNITSINSKI